MAIRQSRSQYLVQLGENLKDAMHKRGVGTMDVAIKLGIGQVSVQRHLRGDIEPRIEQMQVYADLLDTTVDALLPRLDSNQQPAGSGIVAA